MDRQDECAGQKTVGEDPILRAVGHFGHQYSRSGRAIKAVAGGGPPGRFFPAVRIRGRRLDWPIMAKVKNRVGRLLLISLGWLMAGIGFIGLFLPLIPTTGPILLAAFLFSLSSERFDSWLVNHRVFGPMVRDWRAGRGFTVRLKTTAVAAIALTFAVTVGFFVRPLLVRLLLVALAAALIIYILSLPTKPAGSSSDLS